MNKYAQNAVKAAIPVALIGAVALSIPVFSNDRNEKISFENSPAIKANISYAETKEPNGFSVKPGRSTEGIAPLKAAQNPVSWMNAKETCKFTPTISYFSGDMKERGEEFLSKKYLYDEAEKYVSVPSETKTIGIKSTGGDIASVFTSYEVSNDASINKDANSGNYYRTTAVRLIASEVPLAEDVNSPSDKGRKALPLVVLNYDCINKEDYNESDFKKAVKAVKVDFESELSMDIPKREPNKEDSAVDDPSDDIENGYTVIPEKFDNADTGLQNDSRGRGAEDNAPVELDGAPEPIMPPEGKP